MTNLRTKMERRNIALWLLYLVARPTTWLISWCVVDYGWLRHFHLIVQNGKPVLNMGLVEAVNTFFRLSVWSYWLPLAVLWLVDVFIVSPWFQANVIRVKADGI
jgi:hypothetical protein